MLTYTLKKGSDAAVNIKTTYQVNVEKSTGLIGKPSLKNVENFDWKYLHGTTPDLRNRRYQSKEITLSCWMKADSKQQLVDRFDKFLRFFTYDDLMLLKVSWTTDNNNQGIMPNPHTPKNLFALVWLKSVRIDKHKWRTGKNIISFTLIFEDPYPEKRVCKVTGEDGDGVEYDIISDTEIDIYTDNGDRVYDILTEVGKILCPNNTYILICGDVDHAKSNSFDYEAADPEVPVDLNDPSTYVITRYKFLTPISSHDTVTIIYEEI